MPSWQNAVITKLVLPLLGAKRRLSYPKRTRAEVEVRALRPPSYAPPKRLDRKTRLTVRHRDGWLVYEAAPKGRAAAKRVLYLHGGAYIHEIVRQHWSLIGRLVGAVPTRCVVPIYPLAPHGLASEVVPHAAGILAELIGEAGAEDVVLMGDSAGGGMALAVAEELRDRGEGQPSRIVLISPWLDVTMSNPDQAPIERVDPMLARTGLAEAGRLYAGALDPSDPRVSPLNGDLRGLAPMTVFSGTHDVLNTDARRLVEKAKAGSVRIDYHEAEGLPHVYPLLPTPEGRAAREAIVRACRGGRAGA